MLHISRLFNLVITERTSLKFGKFWRICLSGTWGQPSVLSAMSLQITVTSPFLTLFSPDPNLLLGLTFTQLLSQRCIWKADTMWFENSEMNSLIKKTFLTVYLRSLKAHGVCFIPLRGCALSTKDLGFAARNDHVQHFPALLRNSEA